ncbi:MAG: sn-glycerol-3-phosphate ABC transporter ATP-binding protein UgpC [Thiofilum sp.]|uniref:ABC transporter ATP-binding protein n=1 Tax=Thiofilum sp. TaxID=2212733 RepID=UPI0025E4FFF2|nr:sn-glycerol-3-phosphate ABC transporter ATP-binding protein UgpC [Thiofilum sp.]MBK8454394.1 sn-glycerol-3-phosphate ABC transporter ATP-binding protein UgpC [Thiofilum sp.]
MASLEIRNVCKSYGSVDVLKNINISIDHGDFLVLVGPSGCGKSTLLSMIAGLDEITSGELIIDDEVVNNKHPSQRDIAMVFQSYALYPNMSVEKNIAFGLEMRGVPKAERDKKVESVSQMLQIGPLLKRKPAQLSGGQRQRVAMGRALVREPKIFLFDEPLSNLDAKLRVDMRTEIKKLHQRLGATIVYVTHDQIEAMTLATRIAIMKAGILQQLGTPQEVYDTPNNVFVASFMGSPSMNLIPATLVAHQNGIAARLTTHGNNDLLLPFPNPEHYKSWVDKAVILGIRPEAITDVSSAEPNNPWVFQADCLVDVTEPTGADVYVLTTLGGKEIVARMRSNCGAVVGQKAPFAFNMAKAVLFDPQTENRI